MVPDPASILATGWLAFLPDYPTVGESLTFQVTGLVVVLAALCSIWGLVELIGAIFKRIEARRGTAAQLPVGAPVVPAEPATAGQAAGSPGLTPEILAVIAAAVHVTLGGSHRVTVVKPAETAVDWAREGRRQIFASHKVR
jgi:Na+-transporting methylmalonyl-CoA/oxaloacetate decarboxylase gamma subunit